MLLENGQGELGETDVALGHGHGHGHAHIISLVAHGAKAVEHGGDVIGLDEIEHEEHDAETHRVFVVAVEPREGELPNTRAVVGQQAAVVGELEGVAYRPRVDARHPAGNVCEIVVDGRGLDVAEHEGLERSGFHVGDLLRFGVGFHGLEVGGGVLSGDAARQSAEVGNANAQHAFHAGMQAARERCVSAFGQVQKVLIEGEGFKGVHKRGRDKRNTFQLAQRYFLIYKILLKSKTKKRAVIIRL